MDEAIENERLRLVSISRQFDGGNRSRSAAAFQNVRPVVGRRASTPSLGPPVRRFLFQWTNLGLRDTTTATAHCAVSNYLSSVPCCVLPVSFSHVTNCSVTTEVRVLCSVPLGSAIIFSSAHFVGLSLWPESKPKTFCATSWTTL